jgi:hypothetical protein
VEEMLTTLPPSLLTTPSTTFLDPSCGDGNFLVAILTHKIAAGINPIQALHTIYGVELMPDNVEACRQRLKDITLVSLMKLGVDAGDPRLKVIDAILNHNIICHDSLTWDYEAWKPL